MKCECLASSSHGNCFILTFNVKGKPQNIMVECGLPLTTIYSKLNAVGIDISSIAAVLVTHAHGDHSLSVNQLLFRGIPVYASKETFEALKSKGGCGISLKVNQPNKIADGVYVLPFAVDHDCPGSLGFIIKTAEETIIFVNDHKKWTANLTKFKPDYVFIECNYDHKTVYAQVYDLERKKKMAEAEEELKEIQIKLKQHERNINSHCSLKGTIKGLQKLNLKQCKCIFLMHLSDRYANEYRMKEMIKEIYGIQTLVCQKEGGIK